MAFGVDPEVFKVFLPGQGCGVDHRRREHRGQTWVQQRFVEQILEARARWPFSDAMEALHIFNVLAQFFFASSWTLLLRAPCT